MRYGVTQKAYLFTTKFPENFLQFFKLILRQLGNEIDLSSSYQRTTTFLLYIIELWALENVFSD